MSIIEAITLALIAGSGFSMMAMGHWFWVQRHRFFGVILGAGGAAILAILFASLDFMSQ